MQRLVSLLTAIATLLHLACGCCGDLTHGGDHRGWDGVRSPACVDACCEAGCEAGGSDRGGHVSGGNANASSASDHACHACEACHCAAKLETDRDGRAIDGASPHHHPGDDGLIAARQAAAGPREGVRPRPPSVGSPALFERLLV